MLIVFNKRAPTRIEDIDTMYMLYVARACNYSYSYTAWITGKFLKFSWMEDSL